MITEATEAYEAKRWPDGKVPGGKGSRPYPSHAILARTLLHRTSLDLALNGKSLVAQRLSVAGGTSAVTVAQGKMTRLPLEYPLTVVSRSIDGYGRNFLHRMEEQGRWRTLH